jgi:hypothetical protein
MPIDRSHVDPTDNLLRLLDLLDTGETPVIEFVHKDILELDSYSVKDKCRVLSYTQDNLFDEEIVYELVTDFSEFEEENKNNSKANWYNKEGVPCLKWHESNFYPQNKQVKLYLQLPSANAPKERHAELSTGYYFQILNYAPWLIQPEEVRILCVSTAHVTQLDMENLAKLAEYSEDLIVVNPQPKEDHWVSIETGGSFGENFKDKKPETLSQELWDILITANEAGYHRVELDAAAKIYDKLPTFDW